MERPETLYVSVNDAQVAYQVFGSGPDIVWVQGFSNNVDYRLGRARTGSLLRTPGAV